MTDKTMLPTLTLDDLRVSGPNRDEADAFDPSETWWTCCDKVAAGYPADDVASLLLEMDLSDTSLLWCWWRDECMEAAAHGAGREADCPDMLLIAALNAADVRAWRYPLVAGASVAVLHAENAKLRALLGEVLAVPMAATWLCRHPATDGHGGLYQQIEATLGRRAEESR